MLRALEAGPLDEDALVDVVYGITVDPTLRRAALGAVRAYLNHLRASSAVRPFDSGRWSL